jgi:hypothetical protein
MKKQVVARKNIDKVSLYSIPNRDQVIADFQAKEERDELKSALKAIINQNEPAKEVLSKQIKNAEQLLLVAQNLKDTNIITQNFLDQLKKIISLRQLI